MDVDITLTRPQIYRRDVLIREIFVTEVVFNVNALVPDAEPHGVL
jgi:hypothetical protein